ncbi:MAG: non-ribosomal peptide synthase/polyketide synthase [Gammaproteobacteria bacterium]|nr:non-ribosomal peptide synthase/polyketide synthase [Gammaproteobacteria bacterium]
MAISSAHIEDVYPLSPLQQGMLFQSLLHQDSGVYLMQDRYRIGGPLQVDAFLEAWRLVVAAHPALRTSFLWKTQKQPLQVVHKKVELPLEYIDLRDRVPAEQEACIQELLTTEQRTGFNLAKPPLIRFRLVQLDDDTHELVRSFHHILMDAWCISLVMVDCIEAYDALRQGQQPQMRRPRPFREYIAWLQQQNQDEAQVFWQQQLQGLDAATPLAVESAPRQSQYREAVLVDDCLIRFDESQTQTVTRFCQAHRVTPNTLFQGAWGLLLSRYSGNSDVVFGVTVSGRPPELPGVEDMIGLFINTLPLRVRVDEDQAVAPWLQALQGVNLDLREFEHSSLVDIQGWSAFPRGEELFDSILVYENAPFDARLLDGDLSFRLENMEHSVHTHYGLTVVIMPWGSLAIRISYDRRRFQRDCIERMLGHLRQLVLAMVAQPTATLRTLAMLTDNERHQLLVDWNQTRQDFPLDKTYAQLFAAQVDAHPLRIAAVCQGESLTYAELDARASRLAARLIEAGAGPDRIVAVLAERGLGFLTSIIAIFKAGAAYLPLEVKHPPQRLTEILTLSQASLLLADEAQAPLVDQLCSSLPQPHSVLIIDALGQSAGPAPRLEPRGTPADLAYVIFTSGSTGTPKGALVEQRGMLNNIFGKIPSLGLSEQDRIAQTASVAFDISVWQFLAAPLLGATVHILPDEVSHDPERLLEQLEQQQLTVLEAVPSVIRGLLAASGPQTRLDSLRWVLPTGEALPPVLCREWFARFPQIPLMNAYGPAECADDVAFHAITQASDEQSQAMPIGRPTPNNQLFVLDATLRPVPVGVPGEICVAGVGVGRGYLHDPERTRAAFVSHPFQPGARFYRTGDMGRYRADGVIEFLGRRDQQVKVRGHRIELGEIEARLQQHPGVLEAAVNARPDSRGELQLVAYWVRQADRVLDSESLQDALGSQLPAYMIPVLWLELDALPRNSNGKIDRRQLARRELDWNAGGQEPVAPGTATEQTLYRIWAEILLLDAFSIKDSFFALGGHSLLATQVISRIRAAFKVELPLKTLFEYPTVMQLAQAIDARSGQNAGTLVAAIGPMVRPQCIPLSFAQQRLWFIEQLNTGTAHFNVPLALKLSGHLDMAALRQSLNKLIERHEVLRTAFVSTDGEPWQQILDSVAIEIPVVCATAPAPVITPELLQWFEQPFDLRQPPLLRAQVLTFADNEHILAITLHHLVSDAWSATVALRELAQLYAALRAGQAPALPPLPIQYADFALWQRKHLQGEVLNRQLAYWKQALAPATGEASDYLLNLPSDRPRPSAQSYRSGLLATRLAPDLSDRIRALAETLRQSPFSLVMAAFTVLLHRMSGQNDIIVGTPVSDRSHTETESLLGILLNNLPIRADLSDNPSFAQLARRIGDTLLDAQRHQDLPFEQLVDRLALPRSLSHAPLFQVMVAQQLAVEHRVQFTGLELEVLETPLNHSEYDLDLHVLTAAQGPIELQLMHALDLFETATAQRWLERFELLLRNLVANPQMPVAQQPLLTPAEWRRIVVDWNRTEADYPRDITLHEAFERQVARTPSATAVVLADRQLSYAELNTRANRLAHFMRDHGVGPDNLVALCFERSLEMFVAIIGVLKAGGAYVPLDPAHPSERLADMIADADPVLILTQKALTQRLAAARALRLCLDSDGDVLADQPTINPENRTRPDQLAYVIYTSGSTGKPKGTLICHSAVINLAWARIHGIYRPLGVDRMRASFNYSYAFDASVAEFILLLDGHTLYITPEDVRFSPPELIRFFQDTRLDTFECTPAQLKYLIDKGMTAHLPRFVLFGGDAIDPQLWQRLQEIPTSIFFNTYGPTECSVDAIACRIEAHLPRPVIGRPIANVRAYILDAHLNPLPEGVAGELHIGGDGVGQGYLNRPELSAEKFITDPFNPVPGARMYKSGDLARFLVDGTIEYLGRIDQQVKIRGFRVELGEIESALAALPQVREAVVVIREDRPGDKRLVAYLVAAGTQLDLADLRVALKQRLPDYMMPNHFQVLDALPLTGNGKIDRKALPKPDWDEAQEAIEPPSNDLERRMAQLWSQVLDVPVERIGRDANFFHLGGHSLLATILFARIGQHFAVTPALRELFEYPTVAGLASRVAGAAGHSSSPLAAMPRPPRLPLSHAQQRLWFLEQLSPGMAEYNVTSAIAFTGSLNVEWLRQALERVMHRHEILRSRILAQNGITEVLIDPAGPFRLPVESLRADEDADWQGLMRQAADAEASQPFDLARDSLLRARVIQRAHHAEALLLLTLHHCVTDDWSIQCLSDELAEAYRAQAEQRAAQLPVLPIQYIDYSLWQRNAAQQALYQEQLGYWRQTLGTGDYVLNLPTDRARGSLTDTSAGSQFLTLPDELTEQLRLYAQRQGVTLYMILLAALNLFLSRYCQQQDIRIGTAVANRRQAEVQPLIGCFINTLVIKTEVTPTDTFDQLLTAVRHQVLAAQEHQDVPFEQVVEALAHERHLERSPLFQVMFTHQTASVETRRWPDLQVLELPVAMAAAKFDLNVEVHDNQRAISVLFEYRKALFDDATMTRWLNQWQGLLTWIATDPTQALARYDLLSAQERQRILQDWNQTHTDFPLNQTYAALFAQRVALHPTRIAAVCEGEALTYADLDARANRLARALIARGAGPDVVIALLAERGLPLLTMMIAVFKAGAAYLPLDVNHPPQRLSELLDLSGATIVLAADASAALLDTVLADVAAEPLFLIAEMLWLTGDAAAPPLVGTADDLAYVIFTSGSTGTPKGAMVEQRGMLNNIYGKVSAVGLGKNDRLAQTAPIAFDISVWQFLAAPLLGATVHILPDAISRDPLRLLEAVDRDGITLLQVVPSMMGAMLAVSTPAIALTHLRWLLTAGEALPPALCRRWFARFPCVPLLNLYGPTECADNIGFHSITQAPAESCLHTPIGRPTANNHLFILNDDLQPVPIGVPGEICTSGAGVGRGYLNDPERTRQVFVAHPFQPGARFYRTGDIGRFRPDGVIEYLGRRDHQVKVRGQRIELGEVESRLTRHPAVAVAAVLALPDAAGDTRLVAYWHARPGAAIDSPGLRDALARDLPAFMVPALLIHLDKMPLNANGKLDRKALAATPIASGKESQARYVAPITATEQRLAAIWAEILGRPQVGVADNFFALGGHSLLATVLLARLRQCYQVTPTLRQLFEQPTLGQMAALTAGPREHDTALLTPQARPQRLPLSFAQQRLWFLEQLDKDAAEYNITLAVEFCGCLRLDWLRQGLETIVARHEILRARMREVGEGPELIIDADATLPLPTEAVAGDDASWERMARQATNQEAQKPFDLAQDRLIRARALQRRGHQQTLLLLTLHHTIADDWSLQLLLDQLAQCYQGYATAAPAQLPPLPVQYVDYSLWQRQPAQAEHYQRQLAYWQQTLEDGDYSLDLPTDRPRRAEADIDAGIQDLHLLPELSQQLRACAQRQGVTPFVLLLATTQVLLGCLANQRDVRVGTAVANRSLPETQALIGCFVNTLVIRAELEPRLRFSDFLDQVKQRVLAAQEHQDVPFEQVVDLLATGRDLSRTPLFQVMVTMQNTRLRSDHWPGLALREIPSDQGTALFDLDLDIHDDSQQFSIRLHYRRALFDAATIARWLALWQRLLTQMLADPGLRLNELERVTPDERQLLVEEWNRTAQDFPLDQTYAQLFARRVAIDPERTAAVCLGESITYGELDARASRLAQALIAAGAGPDTLVALAAERGLPLLAMMIAVLKAGAACLPLDVNHPPQRLRDLLQQSQAPILLVADVADASAALLDAVLSSLTSPAPQVLVAKSLWRQGPLPALQLRGKPEDLAYVIFTSGSTGTPKGAMVEQRGMLNNIFGKVPALGLGAADRIAQTASPAFDISVWQFLAAPLLGATVHILPDEVARDPSRLLATVASDRLTILEAVPTVIRGLLDAAGHGTDLSALRWLLPTGEALPPDLCQAWLARFPHIPLMNAYGPAECADDVAFHPVSVAPQDTGAAMPIGRPTVNNQLFILDEDLRLLPIGIPGEICVAGAGVGRGYLHDPEKTRAAFVDHPFSPGQRFYRTGDRGRYRADGVIEFLGRRDEQVKVRGHRIELGEIEACLLTQPAVAQGAVIARTDQRGERQLVAYWVAAEQADTGGAQAQEHLLREALAARLPHYMVPATFVHLAQLPLNANGKINRKELAQRELPSRDDTRALVAPRTDNERILCELLCTLLKLERISVTDNFFALGGDSILGLQLIARAKAQGVALTPKQLFQQRTLADLALAARQTLQIETEQGPLQGDVPLLPVQHWLFEQSLANLGHWNQSLLLTPGEPLQPQSVRATLAFLVEYHDALRMRFTRDDDGWTQQYGQVDASNAGLAFEVIQLASEQSLRERLQPVAAGFDLAHGPLLHAALVELPDGRQRLYIAIHHLVIDTVSWRILLEEFATLYRQITAGTVPALPAKTSSYRQWTRRLGRYAESAALAAQLPFWLRQGGHRPLPVDHPAAPRLVGDEICLIEKLSRQETQQLLHDVQQAYRTQVPELLLTALVQTLCEWKGDNALTVELEGHGREALFNELDLSRTVGWFTSLYPLCLRLPAAQDAGSCIKAIKEQLRAVPEHGLGYGVLQYLTRAGLPASSHGVLFNYLGRFDSSQDDGLLRIADDPVPADRDGTNTLHQELEIVPMVIVDQLQVEWRFSRRRYDLATQERLLARYMERLRELLRHCLDPQAGGLTPSDFPLARQLNQKSLDQLLGKLKPNSKTPA